MDDEKPSFLTKWEDYFMAHAHINSLRSKIFSNRRGACLVDKGNKIISNSYNGRPYIHDKNQKKQFDQNKLEDNEPEIGAVENAFYFKTKLIEEGCKLYLTHCPTREEVAKIISNNVKEVIYSSNPFDVDDVEKIKEEFGQLLTVRKKHFQIDVERNTSNKFTLTFQSDTLKIDENASLL